MIAFEGQQQGQVLSNWDSTLKGLFLCIRQPHLHCFSSENGGALCPSELDEC